MISEHFRPLLLAFFGVIILAAGNGCVTAPDSGHKPSPGTEIKTPVKEYERGTFSPSVKAKKLPLSKAFAVYNSSKHKPSGVHVHSGLVFVIVNIDTSRPQERRMAKAKAMLRSQSMLRKHFSLPAGFSFSTRQLEASQHFKPRFFRYCLAYSYDDIMNFKKDLKKDPQKASEK